MPLPQWVRYTNFRGHQDSEQCRDHVQMGVVADNDVVLDVLKR
jgi:hypothetical protein